MKIVFLGTPDFAVPTLEAILAAGHNVQTVVTQPDRPKGRGKEIASSPVKQAALRAGLPVFQPERIRRPEAIAHLAELSPDAMVVVGYGQIIPQSVIDIAPLGIINVHASLLPELRGAAPIQWAIVRGYEKTGVTTMRIEAGLDTGDIGLQWETPIDPEETAPELSARLAPAGARLLVETLGQVLQNKAVFRPQDSSLATWAPILKKSDGLIDWTQGAKTIHNVIRGLQPWPGAFTTFRERSLQIRRSRPIEGSRQFAPGALFRDGGVYVASGNGTILELLEVQPEGGKRMRAEDFANGHRLTEIEYLGK